MLRNQHTTCKYISKTINHQRRCLQLQTGALQSKSTSNVFKQGKIMSKLFGNRVQGSKKRWIPIADNTGATNVVFKQSPFGGKKTNTGNGKNDSRRMTVLNKLFMKHITDLLATGEISEKILGKGLQVSRVKISQDFAYVNVYWITTGDVAKDTLLEQELQRCAGLLRHELSQLDLMGVVPRIKFVKDKIMSNIVQVESLLRNMDFGPEDEEQPEELEDYLKNATDVVKNEFYGNKVLASNTPKIIEKQEAESSENPPPATSLSAKLPEMRHDVLGLDHKGIMLKILTKMRKSKQAWEQHQAASSSNSSIPASEVDVVTTSSLPTESQLTRIQNKLAKAAESAEKFEAFLAKRRERKNTPERKKYRISDHMLDANAEDYKEYEFMSNRQRQLYEAEDYLYEDVEDKKK
ncbi:uncharacterized protein LOC133327989 [Musca vetustissima]|uniref:uncharacterized protein LOC133327989 n=1 Tax=Musca vetustissima TaxID=27455 RepID=UPI002AB5FCE7|nr:uncharacterized protein LOC133327989 [Musca vetustissima]